jgi:hypothetical protein
MFNRRVSGNASLAEWQGKGKEGNEEAGGGGHGGASLEMSCRL